MTWIESFPLLGTPNEYLFFVELEGHQSEARVQRGPGRAETTQRAAGSPRILPENRSLSTDAAPGSLDSLEVRS